MAFGGSYVLRVERLRHRAFATQFASRSAVPCAVRTSPFDPARPPLLGFHPLDNRDRYSCSHVDPREISRASQRGLDPRARFLSAGLSWLWRLKPGVLDALLGNAVLSGILCAIGGCKCDAAEGVRQPL